MYITAQGCRLRIDLYCVMWDIKLYYTIPYSDIFAYHVFHDYINDYIKHVFVFFIINNTQIDTFLQL